MAADGAPLAGPEGAHQRLGLGPGDGDGGDKRGLGGRGLSRADLGDEAVADVARDGGVKSEIILPAENAENVGVIQTQQVELRLVLGRHAAVLINRGPRGARGEVDDASRRTLVGAAGPHVQITGDGVAVHVGGRRLDDFKGADVAGADLAEVNVAVAHRGAARRGDLVAIDQERREILAHATDVDGADVAAAAVDGDAGEALQELAGLSAGVAVGVDFRDGADVGGVAFLLNRGGLTGAEALHDVLVEPVDTRGQGEGLGADLSGADADGRLHLIHAGVTDDDLVLAGGQLQRECAVGFRRGGHGAAVDRDGGATDRIAARSIRYPPLQGARGGLGGVDGAKDKKPATEGEQQAKQTGTGGNVARHGV